MLCQSRISLPYVSRRFEDLTNGIDLLVLQPASLLQLSQQNLVLLLQRLAGIARRTESHRAGEDHQAQQQGAEKFQGLTSFEFLRIT